MNRWLQKKWVRVAGIVLGTFVCLYAMVYVDLILRARQAYHEGEKYLRWHSNPEEKKLHFQVRFDKNKERLDRKRESGKLSEAVYQQKLDLIRFEKEEAVRESSIKYAYIWYQTAVELFSPPESRWVRLSRKRMSEAKGLWKKELTDKGIPFKEYMLE